MSPLPAGSPVQPVATASKVQVLLRPPAGGRIPDDDVWAPVSASGMLVRAGVRIRSAAEAPDDSGAGGTFVGDHPSAGNFDRRYDVMWEVVGSSPEWAAFADVVATRLNRLAPYCDLATCAVSAGTEYTLVAGGSDQDAVMLAYPMRRQAHLSLEAFHDYWLNVHGRFGVGNPNVAGYHQFHVDHVASAAVNAALGLGVADYDGIPESFLPTLDAFANIKTDEGLTQEVLEDERRFIDYGASATMELYHYRVLTQSEKGG